MKLEERIGQTLMIGVAGQEVTPELVALFRETFAGGLILFRRNFHSTEQLRTFLASLEGALQRKLLIAVDHEGGRVIHLKEGITFFPDNLAAGYAGREKYVREQGRIEALELRRLGIDLNLAPTLDVLTEVHSPNIGIRSYGRNPDLTARLGAARIAAMQEAGVSACAKHFPGQGQSPLDAHLGLPVLPTTWEEMKKIHLKPFLAAFQAGVHSVMSSHPVYPNLDPQNIPATFSRKIIHDYLRKELGYRGLILSDDLEMGALRQRGSVAEAAVQTAAAGHDVILICSSAKDQREAFHELKKAYEDGRLDSEELEKSAARIEALKKLRPERFLQGIPLPEKDGKTLAEKIAREGVAKGNPPSRSREENAREVTVIFPRLSEIGVKFALEPELENDAKCVAELLARHGIMPKTTVLLPLDPDEGQVRECLEKVSGGRVLFFCFDAHLFPGNRRLLESLQAKVRGLEVLFLRNPYDHEFLGSGILYAHAFGFRHAQIAAALDVLLGAGAAPHKARA